MAASCMTHRVPPRSQTVIVIPTMMTATRRKQRGIPSPSRSCDGIPSSSRCCQWQDCPSIGGAVMDPSCVVSPRSHWQGVDHRVIVLTMTRQGQSWHDCCQCCVVTWILTSHGDSGWTVMAHWQTEWKRWGREVHGIPSPSWSCQ